MVIRRGPGFENLSLDSTLHSECRTNAKEGLFLCVFEEYFFVCIMSRSYHNKAEFILLRLRRSGINIVKTATIKTRERSL